MLPREADFKLALLIRYNGEITDEEASRRLESLAGKQTIRAWEVQKASYLWTVNWNMNDIPEDLWEQMCDNFEAAKAALLRVFHENRDQCRLKTVEWFEEERKRWLDDLQLMIQLDKGLEDRFGDRREWKFREAKQKLEVSKAEASFKEARSREAA
jgi:hypothetical protein